MVGVQVQMVVAGDVPLIIRAKPRGAIISFLVATIHEFIQIEWMTHCHQKKLSDRETTKANERGEDENMLGAMRFQSSWNSSQPPPLACKNPLFQRACLCLLLAATIGTLLAGSLLENIRFTATVGEEPEGCVRSYNLFSLGTTLTSDFFLDNSEAVAGVWTLFISYVILASVLPIFVHLVHISVCLFNIDSKFLCQAADICATFASIEVVILGLFTVQVCALES